MATSEWQQNTSLKERLFSEYYRFSFFQAVMLLERFARERTDDVETIGLALSPAREAVRFSVRPGFAFPASDISGLTLGGDDQRALLEVAFFGLIGPSGVLPDWYNEEALARTAKKDTAMTAFFDIFHHRLLSLYYLVWKKFRFQVSFRPDAKDRFSIYLRCLIGLGTEQLSGKLGLPEESPMYYGGIMARRLPTASALAATVRYYFGVPADVEQFVGRFLPLAREDRTALGATNGRLGIDTICGSRVWDNQSSFRLNLGPMVFDQFCRFLPNGDRLRPLFSFVKYLVGMEYEPDVRLILKRDEVPPCRLGLGGKGSPRLGCTTWLKAPGVHLERDATVVIEEKDMSGFAFCR